MHAHFDILTFVFRYIVILGQYSLLSSTDYLQVCPFGGLVRPSPTPRTDLRDYCPHCQGVFLFLLLERCY